MIYTTITNIAYYQALVEDAADGETCWSINKNAKPGDLVLLYVCAPISAVAATAVIADEPFLEESINSEFFGTWFAEMNDLALLKFPLERRWLVERFPAWGYWKQPRSSIAVPQAFEPELRRLIEAGRRKG